MIVGYVQSNELAKVKICLAGFEKEIGILIILTYKEELAMLTAFSMDYLKQITVISHIVEQLISILVTQSSFCIEILLMLISIKTHKFFSP